jgi:uncharacterized protein with ATP-grasp and redox domains
MLLSSFQIEKQDQVMQLQQSLNLPKPIILSEEGSFANFTFSKRFPSVLQQVIDNNDFPAEAVSKLEILSKELNQGKIREIDDRGSDIITWNEYINHYLGKRWLELPFFFAEVYFYRRILEAIGYFEYPSEERPDPYAVPKRGSLEKVLDAEKQPLYELEASVKEKLMESLYASLWGNREDLSQLVESQAEQGKGINLDRQASSILVDDTAVVASKFADRTDSRIDLIADNAGSELLRDLYLIDFLLSRQIAGVVHLHLKFHPTFVSDATVRDLMITLEQLENHSSEAFQSLSSRLKKYINSNRLQLHEDCFWTMPLFFWDMDNDLNEDLAQADLVVIKGDANYRRLVGDLHWEHTESFENITSYFPAPLVTLRTLKSELMVGLQPEQSENLHSQDPKWLINGRWGVVQSRAI